jgi:hypothetical protein
MSDFKTLTIKVSAADHKKLKAIAADQGRRLDDLSQLVYAQGLEIFYCETMVSIDKEPHEYTEKENLQLAKNKQLEASKGWSDLDWEQRKKRGYEHVSKFISNHERDDSGQYVDRLIDPLAERIKAFATD